MKKYNVVLLSSIWKDGRSIIAKEVSIEKAESLHFYYSQVKKTDCTIEEVTQ